MIDALHTFLEASFAALSKTQLTASYSTFASVLGYSTTVIVDTAKLDTAFASAIAFSAETQPILPHFDPQATFAKHPLGRLAIERDAPFDVHDVCARFDMSERELRRVLPTPVQEAPFVVFPVHRNGKLVLFVGCSGATPDQTPTGRAVLHVGAQVLYDRYSTITECQTLSRRQADCLFLAAQGKTYVEIGKLLGLSTRTVRADLAKAKRGLNARTKAEAIALAVGRNAD